MTNLELAVFAALQELVAQGKLTVSYDADGEPIYMASPDPGVIRLQPELN